MRFALLDRTYGREPQRFDTLAAAGAALLNIAARRWVVKRRHDMAKLIVPEGKPLALFSLWIAPHDGPLEIAGHHYARTREYAMKVLLAAATKKTWPGAPHMHVVELTAREIRVARSEQRG